VQQDDPQVRKHSDAVEKRHVRRMRSKQGAHGLWRVFQQVGFCLRRQTNWPGSNPTNVRSGAMWHAPQQLGKQCSMARVICPVASRHVAAYRTQRSTCLPSVVIAHDASISELAMVHRARHLTKKWTSILQHVGNAELQATHRWQRRRTGGLRQQQVCGLPAPAQRKRLSRPLQPAAAL
jgi:hypothetical protein